MRESNPLNNFVFKKLFGEKGKSEIRLIDFLNNTLEETQAPITELEILEDRNFSREYECEKLGIIDIKAKLQTEEVVNIEIQLINKDKDLLIKTTWLKEHNSIETNYIAIELQ